MAGIKMASIILPRTISALRNGHCDVILKPYIIKQIRLHHGASNITGGQYFKQIELGRTSFLCVKSHDRAILGVSVLRLASTSVLEESSDSILSKPLNLSVVEQITDRIPEPPAVPLNVLEVIAPITDRIPEPPTVPPDVLEVVQSIGEPSFASLGLGGWTPVGIVENCMEFLHINCSLPWWTSIVIGTVFVRIVIFPLVIIAQRNAAKMNNNLPQLQIIQMKMTEARQSGNQLEAARYAQELMVFMKEKELNPLKNMFVPLAQAPLFISFFMGLRSMANAPVESMSTGGMLWFTDLTAPDQYFLLPIITSATLWVTIEVGTDSARLSAANMQVMKYILRAMPICILPFTVNFPGAILCYWASSNFISLIQVGFLKIPSVRNYFNIDALVHHSPESLPQKPKGFVKGFQDSWTNMKITKELEERHRFDEMQFHRAGSSPIQKTFKYDPTQPRKVVAAKKSDNL